MFGDPVVATAILDRLLHHSHALTIRGDSYRLRKKRRSGLLKSTTIPAQAGVFAHLPCSDERWAGWLNTADAALRERVATLC